MHFTIILNPISGRGNGLASIPTIKQILDGHQTDYSLIQTKYPGHAIELAVQACENGDTVVAAGGDGTSNEVINGLMKVKNSTGKTQVMGVIPVGRGNDFAFSMGIPTQVDEACHFLVNTAPRKVDLGIAFGDNFPDGRYFGNGVGIGFDAVVGFEAAKMKRLKGFTSYIVAALKTIFIYYKTPRLKVVMDQDTITLSALMVSIMNGIRMGGGFFMAPKGDPHDTQFDLCCVSQVSKLKTFPLITRFMKGSQEGHPAVRFYQSKKVVITALQGSIPAHADGETICTNGKEVVVELVPQALDLVC